MRGRGSVGHASKSMVLVPCNNGADDDGDDGDGEGEREEEFEHVGN